MWFCHRVTKIWSVSCHWMAENLHAIFNELHICGEAEFMDQTYHKGFIATPTMVVLTDSFHMLCQHKSNVCYSVSCFRRQFSHDRSLSPCRNSSGRVWHDTNVGSVFPRTIWNTEHICWKNHLGDAARADRMNCFGHNHFHIWSVEFIRFSLGPTNFWNCRCSTTISQGIQFWSSQRETSDSGNCWSHGRRSSGHSSDSSGTGRVPGRETATDLQSLGANLHRLSSQP